MEIWKYFNIKNLKKFNMLYYIIDVILLADIMEYFREKSLKTYELDPAWYYTTPGFAWDCMLKTTKQSIELITDVDKLLMFGRAKRGGLSQCSNRYSEANNKYMGKKFDIIMEIKKAKGVKNRIVKNIITHNDYKICLENNTCKNINQTMIQSKKHEINTIKRTKTGLNWFDDKRYLVKGETNTLSWGHFSGSNRKLVPVWPNWFPSEKGISLS